jgi:type II secretory pathway component GspD/PulD (secretin)
MRRWLVYFILVSWSAAANAQALLQFDVQAQSLEDALRTVAAQANANILYDPSLVTGRRVTAFKSESTLDDMLVRLLDGSGLKHQYVNEKTVTLVRLQPQLIPASAETKDADKSALRHLQRLRSTAAK